MLSSSSPARLPTWLSTSAMRCMVPATINCDFTGLTTQRMPTPGSTDESARMKGSQQPSSTTLMGSTSSNNTLSLLNNCIDEPMLGPDDPVPT
jgi:hypothetical protein